MHIQSNIALFDQPCEENIVDGNSALLKPIAGAVVLPITVLSKLDRAIVPGMRMQPATLYTLNTKDAAAAAAVTRGLAPLKTVAPKPLPNPVKQSPSATAGPWNEAAGPKPIEGLPPLNLPLPAKGRSAPQTASNPVRQSSSSAAGAAAAAGTAGTAGTARAAGAAGATRGAEGGGSASLAPLKVPVYAYPRKPNTVPFTVRLFQPKPAAERILLPKNPLSERVSIAMPLSASQPTTKDVNIVRATAPAAMVAPQNVPVATPTSFITTSTPSATSEQVPAPLGLVQPSASQQIFQKMPIASATIKGAAANKSMSRVGTSTIIDPPVTPIQILPDMDSTLETEWTDVLQDVPVDTQGTLALLCEMADSTSTPKAPTAFAPDLATGTDTALFGADSGLEDINMWLSGMLGESLDADAPGAQLGFQLSSEDEEKCYDATETRQDGIDVDDENIEDFLDLEAAE